jgi:hypothetical protein
VGVAENQPTLDLAGLVTPTSAPKPVEPLLGAVEVRRSSRRRRTVSAYRDGERTIVMIPARMTRAEEREWVEVMLKRLDAQDRRRRPSDAALLARARQLAADYLDGSARPSSVQWVTNQSSRWGSCTPADRSIRLSHRLQGMPGWVVDYVLIHELAHLVEATHSPRFWSLVSAYPRSERARGYLEGVVAAVAAGGAGGDEPVGEIEVAETVGAIEDCLQPDDGWGPDRAVSGVVRPSGR